MACLRTEAQCRTRLRATPQSTATRRAHSISCCPPVCCSRGINCVCLWSAASPQSKAPSQPRYDCGTLYTPSRTQKYKYIPAVRWHAYSQEIGCVCPALLLLTTPSHKNTHAHKDPYERAPIASKKSAGISDILAGVVFILHIQLCAEERETTELYIFSAFSVLQTHITENKTITNVCFFFFFVLLGRHSSR